MSRRFKFGAHFQNGTGAKSIWMVSDFEQNRGTLAAAVLRDLSNDAQRTDHPAAQGCCVPETSFAKPCNEIRPHHARSATRQWQLRVCPDPSLCEDQRCTSRMSLAHTRGAKGARIDWFWTCPPIMSPFATGRIRFADASSADAGNAQVALHVHQPGHEARVYVLDAGSRRNCDPTAQCHPTPA